ncbi:SufE family protein [Micrococcales bacterium 31B]|nr:SufE family protein [Micrococcales bacterium 31B]
MTLPATLQEIVDDFAAVSERDRLTMLLEFSQSLPDLPDRYGKHPELLEPVPECQSPLFIAYELQGSAPDSPVNLFFSAPQEAPTTRGFAAILHEGLDGLTAQEILDVPTDFAHELGLTRAVSALRMRGMYAMLSRVQHGIRAKLAA